MALCVQHQAHMRELRMYRSCACLDPPAKQRMHGALGVARKLCTPLAKMLPAGGQVVDTVVDQRLHGLPHSGSSTAVVAEVVAEHSALPFVPGSHPHAR